LEDEAQEDVWRVHFAGAMALISTVNDVLKGAKKNSVPRKVYEACHEIWNDKENVQHSIFREFIKDERNLILHQYLTSVDLRKDVSIFVVEGRPAYARPSEVGTLPTNAERYTLDQNIFRPMKSGSWAHEDLRDVYQSALDWWGEQLDSIDKGVELTQATNDR
jgi:hypothetical protein